MLETLSIVALLLSPLGAYIVWKLLLPSIKVSPRRPKRKPVPGGCCDKPALSVVLVNSETTQAPRFTSIRSVRPLRWEAKEKRWVSMKNSGQQQTQ